jgi:alpha-glucosidase (family GH31 glycosyl hydrolase)
MNYVNHYKSFLRNVNTFFGDYMANSEIFTPPINLAHANPEMVFQFPKVRITLLTSRFLRIEASQTGEFEDRPSQVFWYRRQIMPKTTIDFSEHTLSIETEAFKLYYQDSPQGINRESFFVEVKDNGVVFHIDDENPGQLPGTARTLDETNGPIHLQPGLISRSGWIQVDDTFSLVFNSEGWLEPRMKEKTYHDLYLLISGNDYKAAIRDYQEISGKPSLFPRAILGNWWSRYWEYSQSDIKDLVNRFEKEEIPLSVFIIDMDWHITKTDNASSGWTGFSWNRSLFPDPPGLLDWLHKKNLLTSLNLHPAEGIHPHEDQYSDVANALGIKLLSKKPIPFDIADKRFADVYFDKLLHPLEAQGVDFWWIDWQQGERTTLPSLDPLWWLNHLHYHDLARDGKKRPMVFSRWGGPGNHRYPIGFSGDTIVSWKSLKYQPYFTSMAANVAYGWWSHDIGGHMKGTEEKELYTRWVQYGVLSPIFRLHCSKDKFIDRQPWAFGTDTLKLARDAMQFRHALVPYLYTMMRRNELEGQPLCTPLYYDFPEEENSYLATDQYMFGSELMAAPIITPLDPDLNQSRQAVWFPSGECFDFFTGERFVGPQWKIGYYGIEKIPLYAKAGAIVPLQSNITINSTDNPKNMDIVVFPGEDGRFTLYEDDGWSQEYLATGGCSTEFHSEWNDSTFSLRISPATGETKTIPQSRSYKIIFRGINSPSGYKVILNGQSIEVPMVYDEITRSATIGPVELKVNQSLSVQLNRPSKLKSDQRTEEKVLDLLHRARMETLSKWKISTLIKEACHDISILRDPLIKITQGHLIALIETITNAGAIELKNPEGEPHILLVNPKQNTGFKCICNGTLKIDPQGTIVYKGTLPIKVDYFGLITKQIKPSKVGRKVI